MNSELFAKLRQLILVHMDKPDRFPAYFEVREKLTDRQRYQLFFDVWRISESHFAYAGQIQSELIHFLKLGPSVRRQYMNAEDRGFYDDLPDMVTAWRGCCKENLTGSSYSLSKKRATWFALRHCPEGTLPLLLHIEEPKELVLYASDGRGEREVVFLLDEMPKLEVIDEPPARNPLFMMQHAFGSVTKDETALRFKIQSMPERGLNGYCTELRQRLDLLDQLEIETSRESVKQELELVCYRMMGKDLIAIQPLTEMRTELNDLGK